MFKGMEYIYAVWKEQSFSAAAKKLYITQPALSNSVKRVEDKIGHPIFDRSSSPIQLTDVGKEYIAAVEQIMASKENFSRYLADTEDLKEGSITFGSGAMLSSYILPELIDRFKKKYPCIKIDVIECGVDEMQKKLIAGEIDLALENAIFPDSLFKSQFLRKEQMILAVPRSWKINEELVAWQQSIENIISDVYLKEWYPPVPLDRFRDEPFLLPNPGSESYKRSVDLCQSYGFMPNAILTLNQQLTSYNMACVGIGAAFVSDTLVKNALPNPNIVYYKLDGKMVERDICFYYKKNRYLSRCIKEFLKTTFV